MKEVATEQMMVAPRLRGSHHICFLKVAWEKHKQHEMAHSSYLSNRIYLPSLVCSFFIALFLASSVYVERAAGGGFIVPFFSHHHHHFIYMALVNRFLEKPSIKSQVLCNFRRRRKQKEIGWIGLYLFKVRRDTKLSIRIKPRVFCHGDIEK